MKTNKGCKIEGAWRKPCTDKKQQIPIYVLTSQIVMITQNNEPVVRGNFNKLCEEFGFPYHSLKTFKSPITYKESII